MEFGIVESSMDPFVSFGLVVCIIVSYCRHNVTACIACFMLVTTALSISTFFGDLANLSTSYQSLIHLLAICSWVILILYLNYKNRITHEVHH